MWRSSALALLLLALAPAARSDVCLPPTFEGGTRLIRPGQARVLWLEPLLRQHEACWRSPARPDEQRVFVYGSSSIFGFPHPSAKSAVGLVNRAFAADGTPAHLFNLGMVWTYMPKDALIVHESQRFAPDVIVYAVTLDDFYHHAPAGFPPLDAFFLANSAAVDAFAAESPPGVAEPLARYESDWAGDRPLEPAWRRWRQAGLFVRVGVEQLGRGVRARWFPGLAYDAPPVDPAKTHYDCAAVHERFDAFWKDWRDWSLLPYLAQLRREHGVEVLVVNWPVAYEPVGDCHNARYRTTDLEAYRRWLRVQASAHELGFLDLHGLLGAGDFVDSIHPTAEGQRRIAGRLGAALRALLAGSAIARAD